MEFLIFFIGFIVGVCVVSVFAIIAQKQSTKDRDTLMEQMKLFLENSANKVLAENSSMLTIKNAENLEEFFKRFKDKLEDFQKRNEENLKFESEKLANFDNNIKNFLAAGTQISKDTERFVNVMKSDNRTQGHWGEIVLERVLNSSGLRNGEEYKIQKTSTEGRPDATVFLPENRCIYIDAKTSLSSWDGFVNATDNSDKEKFLKDFINSTKQHINGLSKRNYSDDTKSPDFVLMFIPIEGCYSLMFCEDCTLWDYAWKNNVMPVSPSTLLAALKIINYFHIVDKQNKNILEMAELCTSIHDKFSALLGELLKIRTNLDTSLAKLNGKGNIISQIQKLETLGCKYSKALPKIQEDDAE